MKQSLYFLCILLAGLMLSSCEANVVENITSTSPNGENSVMVSGTQETWADPWNLVIKGVHDNKEFITGIGVAHMSTPTAGENLRFTWAGSHRCVIEFESHDGNVQEFVATFP